MCVCAHARTSARAHVRMCLCVFLCLCKGQLGYLQSIRLTHSVNIFVAVLFSHTHSSLT